MIFLNQEQERAVKAPNKPVLVIAGAGTGKTRVLIERIVKFINQDGIDHRKILAITFTNKARDEIRSRIASKVGTNKIPPNVFTFHAFFHKLLKKDVEVLNPSLRDFKLLDENDQKAIIRRLIKNSRLDVNLRAAASALSILKINNNDLQDKELLLKVAKSSSINVEELVPLYQAYEKELRDNNYFDYDDLEIFTCKALDKDEVKEYWSNGFDAILIDEFQDTSSIQMEIVKKLVDKDGSNIFCVGDPDQSIYGFRGAKPGVCTEFLDHFKGAECIKLEQNYRSTQHILNVANKLINQRKTDQFSKNLVSTKKEKPYKVQCLRFSDEGDEVDGVLNEIKKIRRLDSTSTFRDFVILYRNNSIAKPYEMALQKMNIEYSVTNSVEFFSRLEIKYIVAFLKLLYFHDEVGTSIYIQNICSVMSMGVGETSCNKFHRFLSENKYSFFQGLEHINECPSLSSPAKKGLSRLGDIINSLSKDKEKSLAYVIEEIVVKSGYEDYVIAKKEEGRLENIRKFADSLIGSGEGKSNREIVDEISLRAKDVKRHKSDDFLLLSTVHQAKGLEYKYVFLVKMTKSVFPSYLSVKDYELDEERRLAYVAITRAKSRLYITSSPNKSTGKFTNNEESLFLEEIKKSHDSVDFFDKRKTVPSGFVGSGRF